jgi:transposase-like protein
MAQGRRWSAETRASAKERFESSDLSIGKLSAETTVPHATLRYWRRVDRWKPQAAPPTRRTIRPEKRPALLRVHLGRATAADVAVLLDCAESTARNELAALRRHPGQGSHAEPVAPHLAGLRDALCRGDLRQAEIVTHLLRVAALVGAEALVARDPQLDRTALAVARMADRIAALPDDPGHAGVTANDDRESDRSLGELRDELYRRLVDLQEDTFRDRGFRGDPEPAGG